MIHILYIRDDPSWETVIRNVLQNELDIALHVQSFQGQKSFPEFVKNILDEFSYVVIIVDIVLDDRIPLRTYGLELASAISHQRPEIPILILSSMVSVPSIFQAAGVNVKDIIVKQDCIGKDSKWLLERIQRNLDLNSQIVHSPSAIDNTDDRAQDKSLSPPNLNKQTDKDTTD